ncbi:hypothetical protein EFY79_00810 [Hanamia caeni]|jgi:subtilisin family serine protease|uniref:Peptidase S8/S53 domain-containing protein n=1 Tax=Hanamia caeni TaxID=2294116 RepID=A0A3M9NQ32_9BACT|nr:S8/S53 family peptidase [Hanamia caeni]RNI39876.1 hypothetical protein EFY79_00810 [Hanamia caeni]
MKAIVKTFLNLRTDAPEIRIDNNPSFFNPGDEIEITETLIGEEYKGSNVWHRLTNGGFTIANGITKDERFKNPLNTKLNRLVNWSVSIANLNPIYKTGYGADTKIGIIDLGIEKSHFDLAENIIGINDFTDPNLQGIDDSKKGHGTHISGIIAAKSKFSNGVVGVAPNAKIAFAKVIGNGMSKPGGEQIFEGLNWLNTTFKPHVYNASLGFNDNPTQNILSILDDFQKNNKIIVAAAGDDKELLPFDIFQRPNEIQYPARHPACIKVGSVKKENLSDYDSIKSRIDILCPNIPYMSCSNAQNDFYIEINGSSMCTAFISGIIALIISSKIKKGESLEVLSKDILLNALKEMSTPVSQFNYDNRTQFQFNVC